MHDCRWPHTDATMPSSSNELATDTLQTTMRAQQRSLRHEFQAMAIAGAMQHAPICNAGIHEPERVELGQHMRRRQLEAHARPYRTAAIDGEPHVDAIEHLATALTTGHASILANGHFRIGPTQKLLNLYFKCLWCADFPVGEPPHCPVNAIVLAQAGRSDIKWTQVGSRARYMEAINAPREVAARDGQSLAVWKLHAWKAPGTPSFPFRPVDPT